MTEFAIFLIQNARIPIAILLLFVFLFLLLTLIKPVNSNLISKFNKYFSFKILRVPRPLFLLSLAVFLVVVLIIAYKTEGTGLFTLVFFSQLVFDPTLIWQTRTVRMYTMFYTLFFLIIHLILRLIKGKVTFKNQILLSVLGLLLFFVTYQIHPLTVLLIPTVILFSYLGLMIFATNRYNNLRYLFPAVVIVYWFFAQGVIFTIYKAVKILKLGSNSALLIAAVIILLFGVKISIPNLTKNTLFTSVTVANSFPDPGLGYTTKYREIYDYIRVYNPEAKIFSLHGPHQLWYAKGLVVSTVPDIVPNLPPSSKKYFTDENTAISKVKQELDENPEFIVNFENYFKNNNVQWLIVDEKIEPTWFSKMIEISITFNQKSKYP